MRRYIRTALYLLVIIVSYVISLANVLMANSEKYVKVYYKIYANERLNVISPLGKIGKDE